MFGTGKTDGAKDAKAAKDTEKAAKTIRAAIKSAEAAAKSFGSSSASAMAASASAIDKVASSAKAATAAVLKLKKAQDAAGVAGGGGGGGGSAGKGGGGAGSGDKGKDGGGSKGGGGKGDKGESGGDKDSGKDKDKGEESRLKKLAGSAKGVLGGVKDGAGSLVGMLKGSLPLLAALAGGAGLVGIGKIAVGYKAMSQMQGILARTQIGFRQLFAGVNAAPLVRALDRFSKNFTSQTVTGRALGDVLTRSFNGIFAAVEKAEPYVTAFGQGIVLAFLYAENAVLRARVALAPYTGAMDSVVSSTSLMKAATVAGGVALVTLGGYALVASAPIIAIGAAFMAVAAAIEQASKLAKEWDGSAFWRKVKSDIGISGQADFEKDMGITVGSDNDKPKASADGKSVGVAFGDGLVLGMQSKEDAARAAGASLATAADEGLRTKAEIHSPSRLFRRSGRNMGEGVALGQEDMEGRVQKAAASSLVPDPPKAGSLGALGGGRGSVSITAPLLSIGQIVVQGAEELRAEVWRVLDDESARIAELLGLPAPARA